MPPWLLREIWGAAQFQASGPPLIFASSFPGFQVHLRGSATWGFAADLGLKFEVSFALGVLETPSQTQGTSPSAHVGKSSPWTTLV